jgi:RNA polymerase sigma-70 factor (ECF subfamily)
LDRFEECVTDFREQPCIRAAQAGDSTAFGLLVAAYWTPIQRWLLAMTHHAQTAEDLAQETFLKAWTRIDTFHEGNFRAWLFCIARHCLVDSQRGRRARPMRGLPAVLPESGPGPVATLQARETLILVNQAIADLPEKYRAPFLLRTQEELSYAEIAQVLDLTEETVRWRVFRARHHLLKELGDLLEPETS